jgi:hypothetical protein
MSQEEEVSQQEDLDSLLNEYEESSPKPEETPDVSAELKALREEVAQLREQEIRKDTRNALDEAVKEIQTLGDFEGDPDLIEGYLHKKASQDARLVGAFAKRMSDPESYKKVLASLASEMKPKFSRADAKVTEDQDALRASVRGQEDKSITNDHPSPKELGSMTRQEFEKFKEGLLEA